MKPFILSCYFTNFENEILQGHIREPLENIYCHNIYFLRYSFVPFSFRAFIKYQMEKNKLQFFYFLELLYANLLFLPR